MTDGPVALCSGGHGAPWCCRAREELIAITGRGRRSVVMDEHADDLLSHSALTQAFELEHRATEAADHFC
jgi:hypothetical protein